MSKRAFGIAGGASITHAELEAQSAALADGLHGAGLRVGDVLGVLIPNQLEWAEVVWAGLRSGLRVVLYDHHLDPAGLGRLLAAAPPAAAVVAADFRGTFATAAMGVGARPSIIAAHREELDALGPGTPHEPRAGARIVLSAGTTGPPKVLSEQPFGPSIRLAPLMERLGIDAGSVVLSPGPCYHSAPFGFHTTVIRLGGSAMTMARFDVEAMARSVADDGVTHLHLVPTMLYRMLRAQEAGWDGLEAVILGGAPCAPELKAAALNRLGPIVHEYYGASEGYGQTHARPEEALACPGTVGRAINGNLHITDADGEEVPPGTVGRVCFSGRTFGDLGHLDEEGFLFLAGRESQLVISGGVNIHPQEVEDVLAGAPGVDDAAAFGMPDPEWGERLVVLVAGDADPADLHARCDARLARHMRPREIRYADAVPRSAAGKTLVEDAREAFTRARRTR